MRTRSIEHDEVKLAADDRADGAALSPQLIAVEMLIVELESAGAEERTRLDRQRVEIHGPATHPIEALEHRGDLGRSHIRPELRHLLVGRPALADHEVAAPEAGDERDAIEQRTVQRPILDGRNVVEHDRTMTIP